ncbi:MAG: ABC transporter permease [Ktedonobacteraceae bacterium]|nr:ABC transporter permease [Ktedonobacteraceae bacterium]
MSKQMLPISEQEAPEQHQASVVVSRGGAANQNTWRNIGLIIGREYKNRITQRSFLIGTVVILVLVIIGAFIPTIFQVIIAKTSSQTKVAIVNNAGPIANLNGATLTNYIATNLNGAASQTSGQNTNGQSPFAISTVPANSASNEQQQVKNGHLDVLLVIDRSGGQDIHFTYYTNAGSLNDTTQTQIQALAGQLSLLDKASRLGLTPAQTSSLFAQPAFTVVNTKQNQDNRSISDLAAGYIIAIAGFVLIYMWVTLYGTGVATGVAEEKGNRIMEILVNATTPFQLMVGKIIGIGAVGLTQMVTFVTVGIIMLLLQNPLKAALLGTNSGAFSLSITGTLITLLILLLIYFILGFLLYATLFAAAGALVKRQDEVQNAILPITFLSLIGYLVSFAGISNPNATWFKIISYIPFWTPTTMLIRIGVGQVAGWEIALTIVLMIAAVAVCAFISARIYRFGILMYGQKPGLGQLIKVVRTQ